MAGDATQDSFPDLPFFPGGGPVFIPAPDPFVPPERDPFDIPLAPNPQIPSQPAVPGIPDTGGSRPGIFAGAAGFMAAGFGALRKAKAKPKAFKPAGLLTWQTPLTLESDNARYQRARTGGAAPSQPRTQAPPRSSPKPTPKAVPGAAGKAASKLNRITRLGRFGGWVGAVTLIGSTALGLYTEYLRAKKEVADSQGRKSNDQQSAIARRLEGQRRSTRIEAGIPLLSRPGDVLGNAARPAQPRNAAAATRRAAKQRPGAGPGEALEYQNVLSGPQLRQRIRLAQAEANRRIARARAELAAERKVSAVPAPIAAPSPAAARAAARSSLGTTLATLVGQGLQAYIRAPRAPRLTALAAPGVASPLATPFAAPNTAPILLGAPGGTGRGRKSTNTCECGPKKPRKPKAPRTVCYRGSYVETSKGLTKERREQVPCR